MAWLYRTEAKGIQGYVLATGKLREMAGASALIEELSRELTSIASDMGGEVLAAAAGGATVKFPQFEALRRFRALWPLRVARACPGLSVSQAWVEASASDEKDGFVTANDLLRQKLRAASTRPWIDLPEAGPWVARSGRTGLPAVEVTDRDLNSGAKRDGCVDAATRAKIECYRQGRSRGSGRGDALDEKLRPAEDVLLAADMEELGDGYVAVIHADGNGIGKLIAERKLTSEKFREFSKRLKDATGAAARAAVLELHEATRPRDGDLRTRGALRVLPVRPILLGGDDFTAIVAAQHAMPFVATFLRRFEEETRGIAGAEKVTAAAGLAFVKVGFPFHQAYKLCEELCKEAKKLPVPEGQARPSALAFYRVTTAAARDFAEVKEHDLSAAKGADGKGRVLHDGPWTLGGLEKLRALARALGDVPRGGAREWLRLAKENDERAAKHWARVREVMDAGAREALELALHDLGVDPTTLWKTDGKTPIQDALCWRSVDPSVRLPKALETVEATS